MESNKHIRETKGHSRVIPTFFQHHSNGFPTFFQGHSNGFPTFFQGHSNGFLTGQILVFCPPSLLKGPKYTAMPLNGRYSVELINTKRGREMSTGQGISPSLLSSESQKKFFELIDTAFQLADGLDMGLGSVFSCRISRGNPGYC